jgi:hypothetical protein
MCTLSTRYSQLASRIALVLVHSASVLYGIVHKLSLFTLEIRNSRLKSHHMLPSVSHRLALSSLGPLPTKPPTLVMSYRPCSSLSVKLPLLILISSLPNCPPFSYSRSFSRKCHRLLSSLVFPPDTPHELTHTHVLRRRKESKHWHAL